MKVNHRITEAAQRTIDNVRQGLSDQPDLAASVVALLVAADEYKACAQTAINESAWSLGLSRMAPRPLAGSVEDQSVFISAWIRTVQPSDATLLMVRDLMGVAASAMNAARVFATQAQLMLRKAGDAATE